MSRFPPTPPAGRLPPQPFPGANLPLPPLPPPEHIDGGFPAVPQSAAGLKASSPGIRLWSIWALIFACTALIMSARAESPKGDAAAVQQNEVQLSLISRYAVGCKLLFGAKFMPPVALDKMAQQVRDAAKDDADRVKIVPVIAELEGNKAAAAEAAGALYAITDTEKNDDLKADAALLQTSYANSTFVPLDRQRELQDRFGWFGSLAVWQLNGDQAAHDLAVGKARLAVIVIWSLLGGGGLFLLAGLVLAIVFLTQWSAGAMPPRFVAGEPAVADAFAEGFAIYIAGLVAMILASPLYPAHANFAWNAIIVIPFVLAFAWIRGRGVSWGQIARQTGFHRGRGIIREMLAGVIGYIGGLPLMVAGVVLCAILSKHAHVVPTHPIEKNILEPGWTRFWLYLLACVYAPITEELMFRGMLFRHVSLRMQWLASALIVSLIFAAIHPQGWTAIPVLGAIAMVLTLIRYQRDSIVGSMTAHALNNFLAITIVVLAAG
jgi:membrane protease YdiL (CAAX protease family)